MNSNLKVRLIAQACTLLLLSNFATASDSKPNFNDGSLNIAGENTNEAYPDKETLKKLYYLLASSGKLESNLVISNPSVKTLREVYDYAVESGRIDPMRNELTATNDQSELNRPEGSIAKGLYITEDSVCGQKSRLCAAASVGTGLACGAAIAEVGINLAADAGCTLASLEGTSACTDMVAACPKTTHLQHTTALGQRGSLSTGTAEDCTELRESMCEAIW